MVVYVVQIAPWALMFRGTCPALALLGASSSLACRCWQRRTLWRVLALVTVVLLAGAELAALQAMRLPPYTGPIAVGHPFPAFEAKQADGTPFGQNNLTGDQHHVAGLLFRGRW